MDFFIIDRIYCYFKNSLLCIYIYDVIFKEKFDKPDEGVVTEICEYSE